MVVMMMAFAIGIVALVVVVMVVMMLVLVIIIVEFKRLSGAVDYFEYFFAVEHIPRCCNDYRICILFAKHSNYFVDFFSFHACRAAENDSVCIFNLIIVELTEVLHIHFAFSRVCYRCRTANFNVVAFNLCNSTEYVGKLAYTGRLDYNSVGVKFFDNLRHSFAEIADKAAADATGIHFRYLYSGILQKSAVDAYLTEFVFDKHDFFACISFLDKLFDKRCFAGTQETGKNIYFCQFNHSFFYAKAQYFLYYSITYI